METKIKTIIERLIETVDYNDVYWNEGSKESQFTLTLNVGTIIISKEHAEDEYGKYLTGYSICVLETFGRKVIQETIYEFPDMSDEERQGFKLLYELYALVDRKVRKVDDTLDRILTDLNMKLPF